jgi:hypothetical protein
VTGAPAGTIHRDHCYYLHACQPHERDTEQAMNGIIYLIGLIVVVLAILSFLGFA